MNQKDLFNIKEQTVIQQSPQTVTITQTDPNIFISLPNLQPYYANIGANSQISYGITYFDFPLDQYNLRKGDKLYMGMAANFSENMDINAGSQMSLCSSNLGLGVELLSITEDCVCNAYELAKMINVQLRALASYESFQIQNNNQTVFSTASSFFRRCWWFMAKNCLEFSYDGATSKFYLALSPTHPITDITDLIPIFPGFHLQSFELVLNVDPTATDDTQLRLRRMIGAPPTKVAVGGQPGAFINEQVWDVYQAAFKVPFEMSPISLYTSIYRQSLPTTYPQDGLLYPKGSNVITLYGPEVPKLGANEFIYIHSSGYSGEWDQKTTCKTDIIAIVPTNRSFGSSPAFSETRVATSEFFVNDTLNSVRSLQLRLTDSNGHLLPHFHTPYTLQVTIKFI